MWRRAWSSPSTTRTNCTSVEQRIQMARRTPTASSDDDPGRRRIRQPGILPAITPPEAGTPCTRWQATARLSPGVFGGGVRAAAAGAGRSCERGEPEARLGQSPAQRHILRLMPERPPNAAGLKLGAEPGLCGACRHVKLNEDTAGHRLPPLHARHGTSPFPVTRVSQSRSAEDLSGARKSPSTARHPRHPGPGGCGQWMCSQTTLVRRPATPGS